MRSSIPWLVAVALAGCKFEPNQLNGDDDDGGTDGPNLIDAAPDAPPDAFLANCFGGGAFYFCLAAEPTTPETFDNVNIDTDACAVSGGAVLEVAGTESCVIDGDTITLSRTVGLLGSRPIVFVARNTITIGNGAVVDAASAIIEGAGPDAPGTPCDAGTQAMGNGGGGAGGSFGSPGGAGGTGTGGAAAGGIAGAIVAAPVTTLRGGCNGGAGTGAGGGGPAAGGTGGGAIYLVARNAIILDGVIDASGAGGVQGNQSKGGAGGGGSGGMIVLHAGALQVGTGGRVVANGGGGGAGANTSEGSPGAEPDPNTPSTPAEGGPEDTSGLVPGGDGAAGATAATAGTNSANGGGGAGGGHGVVRVLAGGTIPAAQVSPAPN